MSASYPAYHVTCTDSTQKKMRHTAWRATVPSKSMMKWRLCTVMRACYIAVLHIGKEISKLSHVPYRWAKKWTPITNHRLGVLQHTSQQVLRCSEDKRPRYAHQMCFSLLTTHLLTRLKLHLYYGSNAMWLWNLATPSLLFWSRCKRFLVIPTDENSTEG